MSVEHIPAPPDRPTNEASPQGAQTQPVAPDATGTNAESTAPQPQAQAQQPPAASATATEADQPAEPQAPPMPLNEDMARILLEQAEVIVQRQMYHSQMLVGVSALGSDPVSARNAVLTVANALRNHNSENLEHALVNLGDPQLPQVNDHTLPWKFNAQVAGLMEGLIIDTLVQAYRDDPAKQREARSMLEGMFLDANERAEQQHKAQLAFLAPGPHPNARR